MIFWNNHALFRKLTKNHSEGDTGKSESPDTPTTEKNEKPESNAQPNKPGYGLAGRRAAWRPPYGPLVTLINRQYAAPGTSCGRSQ